MAATSSHSTELVPCVHPELARMTARAMAHDAAARYDDLETLRRELAACGSTSTAPLTR
jgi:hypothetical protein